VIGSLLLTLGATACGDSESVSPEEAKQQAQDAVTKALNDQRQKQQLANIQARLKRLQHQRSNQDSGQSTNGGATTVVAPSTTGSTSSGGAIPSGAGGCGSGIYVNAQTSCPFALNVASDYLSSGSSSVTSYSPATGNTYAMTCSGADPVVCTGGNNAAVYIDR
jgi:hypothetical protein